MDLQKYKKNLIWLLIALLFITQACTDIYLPALPDMAREFGVNPDKMNLTITVYVYTQAFLFLIMGVISNLFGRKKTIVYSLVISIIASFLIAISSNLYLIVFLRTLQAIGSGAVYVVSRLIIKEVYDREEQIHITGLFVLGLVISPAIAPVLGSLIIGIFNWRSCFIAIGISLGILVLISSKLIRESNLHMEENRTNFHISKVISSYICVLRSQVFIKFAIVIGGAFASFYAFISMSSYMYINEYHVNHTYYSFIFTAIAMGYLLGNKIMLFLNKRGVSPRKIVQAGIVIALIASFIMIISLISDTKLMVLGIISMGGLITRISTAFINPPIQVEVTHYFKEESAMAIGLLSFLQYIFAGFGSWFVGKLPLNPSHSIVISSIFFASMSLLAFISIAHKDFK